MEGLLSLVALLAVASFIAAPIMAIVALVRTRQIQDLSRLVEELRSRIIRLEVRLSHAAPPAGAPRAEAPRAETPRTEAPRTEAARAEAPRPDAPRSDAPPPDAPPVQAAPPVRPAPAAPPTPPARPPIPPMPPRHPAPAIDEPSFTVRPSSTVDWERWVGIRGAAVLGAIALGLAGLLFFKYSLEHNLSTPEMRVVFGTMAGIACLAGAETLRRRGYDAAAEALSGAGVVILYAAFWAAHVLYGLIGMPVAFALMVLVTAACCLLAVRHGSQLVAVLGLVGGFATPLVLASNSDRPFGLFGYVLLLDIGLIAVGRRRAWPILSLLSLLGTVLIQGLWIGARMGPDRLVLGLVILGAFAALFVVAGSFLAGALGASGAAGAENAASAPAMILSQAGALLFPFVFAIYFAARADLGAHLYPIAILMAFLSAGAAWVARSGGGAKIGRGAAAGCVAVVGVWLVQHTLTLPLAWEAAATAVGLAAIFHVFVELHDGAWGVDSPALEATLLAVGMFVLLLFAAGSSALPPWPWLAGWALLAALLYRQAGLPDLGMLQVVAAVGLGAGLSSLHLAHGGVPQGVAPTTLLGLFILASTALLVIAVARGTMTTAAARGGAQDAGAWAGRAAAALPIVLLLGLVPSPFLNGLPPLTALGTALVLGLLTAAAATRRASGGWYAAGVTATLLVQTAWTWSRPGLKISPAEIAAAFALETIAVLLFTAWPFLSVGTFAPERGAWYAAALAGPAWFPLLRHLFVWRFGDGAIGLLPLGLGLVSLAAVVAARQMLPEGEARLRGLVWFAAVALCFVAVAIPLQLHKEWITIGWALEGLAVIALWRRLDHPGLKYFGLILLGAATARLVANPALLAYYPRPAGRFVNWLLYTYLVPAAALVASAALLEPYEVGRARDWEKDAGGEARPIGSAFAGLAAIAVVFVWINLAIASWFATGPTLTLSFGDRPAQRLTVSIAWGIYALVLLGIGVARNAAGPRWISLAVLLITIGKVFLYDLGALTDLYRVASLVGLAVSLILVSLLYQRFVFRGARGEGS